MKTYLRQNFDAMKKTMEYDSQAQTELIKKFQSGDEDAIIPIIENNIRLVMLIANKIWRNHFRKGPVEHYDIVVAGIDGIRSAAKRFDETKNVKFSTYASIWIKYAIKKELVHNIAVTVPVNSYLRAFKIIKNKEKHLEKTVKNAKITNNLRSLSMQKIVIPRKGNSSNTNTLDKMIGSDESFINYIRHHDNATILKIVGDFISEQSEKEKTMLYMRMEGYSLEEIGQRYSITRERVRQIIRDLLKKIKYYLYSKGIEK
jgi:RNA polymerase sigma factor (sigma-70 family)